MRHRRHARRLSIEGTQPALRATEAEAGDKGACGAKALDGASDAPDTQRDPGGGDNAHPW